ncbi:RNA polymerase sigma factor [Dyadobacter arcticus]|uniref:RNA polymerase sigma-70 factor (ECF subfamily) n=1 Tax=Dyadobacter arcticus TaxID=1078754 RepID=A0ABX0UHQ7_9BACT|nr:sigma-70 family RNA polymerase sigma factor [Dyadobacter arcticus]NIJ52553.1 RNA polymerase sigma-70 factor (ECF subfamily) [Dyadobacter arcticus]
MSRKSIFYCENELVILLKANDRAAFEYLYDNYAAGLYGIIRRIVRDDNKADDVMQDSFIKIWKNIASYDADKGTLFTWLLNVARHTAIDRSRTDAKFENNTNWDLVAEKDLMPSSAIHYDASALDLKEIVNKLRPEKRQLIQMLYFEGYTHEEASEYLCLPLGTVKSRVRKALSELRQVFDIPIASAQVA